jgi:hypothetical protein
MPVELDRARWDAATLLAEHPPVLRHPNKRVVFEVACPPGSTQSGSIHYSRWPAVPLPPEIDPEHAAGLVLVRVGIYDYQPLTAGHSLDWHVNFADRNLFFGYGSGLFAQDEMQVAEHPALGSVREALLAAGRAALTVEEGRPTPVLVAGVERRCRIDTGPRPGAPGGLYGNAFGAAAEDVVRSATEPLDPPMISNVLAMAAPANGGGRYRRDEVDWILDTALTGFMAAVAESHRLARPAAEPSVVVHSGFWGCGAFGGNRVLMALLQVIAAGMAGLDALVFHTGRAGGRAPLDEALRIVRGELAPPSGIGATADVLDAIVALGLTWGVGDGN